MLLEDLEAAVYWLIVSNAVRIWTLKDACNMLWQFQC